MYLCAMKSLNNCPNQLTLLRTYVCDIIAFSFRCVALNSDSAQQDLVLAKVCGQKASSEHCMLFKGDRVYRVT